MYNLGALVYKEVSLPSSCLEILAHSVIAYSLGS